MFLVLLVKIRILTNVYNMDYTKYKSDRILIYTIQVELQQYFNNYSDKTQIY